MIPPTAEPSLYSQENAHEFADAGALLPAGPLAFVFETEQSFSKSTALFDAKTDPPKTVASNAESLKPHSYPDTPPHEYIAPSNSFAPCTLVPAD